MWALDRDDPDDQDLGVRILVALAYEVTMDRSTEYGSWAEHALARVDHWPPGFRNVVLGIASHGAFHRADFPTALRYAEESVDGLEPLAPGSLLPPVSLGAALVFEGRADEAVRVMEESYRRFEEAGAGDYERWNLLSVLLTFRNMTAGTIGLRGSADEALRLAQRIGNPSALAISLSVAALSIVDDDPRSALSACDEGLALTEAGASDVMLSITRAVASTACRPWARIGERSSSRSPPSATPPRSATTAVSASPSAHRWRCSSTAPPPKWPWRVPRALEVLGSLDNLALEGRERARTRARNLLDAADYAAMSSRIDGLTLDDAVELLLAELDREIAALAG